jgi:hypothetical protein
VRVSGSPGPQAFSSGPLSPGLSPPSGRPRPPAGPVPPCALRPRRGRPGPSSFRLPAVFRPPPPARALCPRSPHLSRRRACPRRALRPFTGEAVPGGFSFSGPAGLSAPVPAPPAAMPQAPRSRHDPGPAESSRVKRATAWEDMPATGHCRTATASAVFARVQHGYVMLAGDAGYAYINRVSLAAVSYASCAAPFPV